MHDARIGVGQRLRNTCAKSAALDRRTESPLRKSGRIAAVQMV